MIRRCFGVFVLLTALTLTAFGGHVRVGSGMYCNGDCVAGKCNACGDACAGEPALPVSAGPDRHTSSAAPEGDVLSGLLFGLFVITLKKNRC